MPTIATLTELDHDARPRLLHRSFGLNLDGDCYRLREHRAPGEALRYTITGARQQLS